MTKKKTTKDNRFDNLNKFLRQNKKLDLSTVNLLSAGKVDELNWKGLDQNRDRLLKELKAYQRLLRIIPDGSPKIIKALLSENIHSAIQIAAIPKQQFVSRYLDAFGKKHALIEEAYKKAVAIRSQILIRHMDIIQNAEPHVNAVKLSNPKK
ncbi:hypothetical protein [Xanthovirga aplysinae]|uniref:hypothetical protein n=1 Tax=Xanthovirga aplysinae TaxID=2529853 RepID=UPI0012BC1B17|nr:hypothetical protein [Xanthovirga aplysinae]MTI29867.1 hypothetical protein [Xanthovirga aplysinae]